MRRFSFPAVSFSAAVFVSAALLAAPSQVLAATGSTSVAVAVPEIIILHYRSALNIKFSGGSDSATDEGDANISLPLNAANGDGTLTASGTATTIIPVTVKNMWAVRGITTSGNFQIDAAITSDTASLATSDVVISDLEAVAGGSSGASITVASAGLATSSAVVGGIAFKLDITDVTQTGMHSGIGYTITATSP